MKHEMNRRTVPRAAALVALVGGTTLWAAACSSPQMAADQGASAPAAEVEPAAEPPVEPAGFAGEPIPTDEVGWLDSSADGRVLPVFTAGETRWVQLEELPNLEHPLLAPDTIPDAWFEAEDIGSTMPAPDGVSGHASAVLVTETGTCTAALGPPTLVNRNRCSRNVAFAQEVHGCQGGAPFAWVSGAPPADVVYAPVDFVEEWPWLDDDAEVPTLDSNAPLALLAAYESEFLKALTENGIVASAFESAAAVGWASGGGEVVSILIAGAHTLDTEECSDWAETYVTVGFEVDGSWHAVADQLLLSGVFARGEEMVALVSAHLFERSLMARRDTYVFEEVMHEWFWTENAECHGPWTPVSFEMDCGP